jgi:hypothetical protein
VAGCAAALALIVATGSSSWGFTPDSAFDSGDFSDASADGDNTWFPLVPGTQYVYDGVVEEDGETTAHRVIYTVTDMVKVIDGVLTRVIWDRDLDDGELAEEELAFQAQDADGTVWSLGEYPEEHGEDGEISAPATWLAGIAGAKPGILMQADPRVGTPQYRQGYAPRIEFDDRGTVSKTGVKNCVADTCYTDVVVVDETSATQPDDGHQLKYHAPGVGIIRIVADGGESQETLTLSRIYHLNDSARARANERVRALEDRAYDGLGANYAKTPRAHASWE